MNNKAIFLIILLFHTLTVCNTQTSPSNDLNPIQSIVQNVEDSKNKYEQTWEVSKTDENKIIYTRNIIDVKKANTTLCVSEINLALMDEKSMKIRKAKELFGLEIRSMDIKTIRYHENDADYSYTDRFELYFSGKETAVQCDSLLKLAILESKRIFDASNSLPSTYNDLSEFISSRIINFQANNLKLAQNLSYDSNYSDLINLSTKEKNGVGEQMKISSSFSLGDLDPEKVKLKNAHDHFIINLNTKQKQPFIESRNLTNEKKSYSTDIDLQFGTPENALLVQRALEKQILLAKDILDQRLVIFKSIEEAREAFALALNSVRFEDDKISQVLEFENHKMIYSFYEGKNKQTREFYIEDFDDDLNLGFKAELIKANPRTINKVKYVKVIENDLSKGFDRDFTFFLSDIESMRTVSRSIKYLQENSNLVLDAKDLNWLTTTTTAVQKDGLDQNLTISPNKKCELIYSVKGEESSLVQTFALYDIDPRSIKIEAKGNKLFLELKTVDSHPFVIEKSNDKEIKYVKDLTIVYSDVVNAKIARLSFMNEIENCTEYYNRSSDLRSERDSFIYAIKDIRRARRTKIFQNGKFFEKNSNSLNFSIGILSNVDLKETAIFNDAFETRALLPGLQLTYEKQIWQNLGIGLSLATQMWRVTDGGASDQYGTLTYRYAAAAIRTSYHFNLSNQFDPYIGATMSTRMMDIAEGSKSLQARFDFRPSWLIGLRYYYSNQWGFFIEAGDENINWLRLGISYYHTKD